MRREARARDPRCDESNLVSCPRARNRISLPFTGTAAVEVNAHLCGAYLPARNRSLERRLTRERMMDFLNRGSPKRERARPARAGRAPETATVDIYALLMHRKHFTPIAATMDLIVYREVTCARRAFRCAAPGIRCAPGREHEASRQGRFVSALFLRMSVSSPAPNATRSRDGLAGIQNVFINCPYN